MITRIAHLGIPVADAERSLRFYRDVLGLERCARPALDYPGAWLSLGDQQLHLMQLGLGETGDARRYPGRDRHVALGVEDLAALRRALDAAGVSYTLSRSGRAALFCRDPDGNGLEFIEERARGR